MNWILGRLRPFFFIAITVGGASSISLIGGIALETIQQRILPLIPLLIALPALNTVVGDYATIIAAHAGDPQGRPSTWRNLSRAISKVIWINISGIFLLSISLAWLRGHLVTLDFALKFLLFVVLAVIIVVTTMFFITKKLDIILEKKRLNADDILIPIVTTVSDIMMLGLIMLSTVLIF